MSPKGSLQVIPAIGLFGLVSLDTFRIKSCSRALPRPTGREGCSASGSSYTNQPRRTGAGMAEASAGRGVSFAVGLVQPASADASQSARR